MAALYGDRDNRLLIVGHSFVRRMKQALSRADWDVEEEYERVDIIGVGWMRVSGLKEYVRHARLTLPTVVVIDATTNDMCSPHCQGTAVAARLHDIACQFAELPSTWHVIVGEVIRRGGRNRHFEQESVTCNRELRRHTHSIDYFAHSKVALLMMCTTIL